MIRPSAGTAACTSCFSGTVRFVIAAYREELSIEPLLQRVAESMSSAGVPFRIVVVDDGSGDETAARASAMAPDLDVVILRNGRNRGLGFSLARGMSFALAESVPGDVIVTLDADLTQDPGHVPAMIERHLAGADIVIASRFRRGSRVVGVPFGRRVLTACARLVMGVLMPVAGVRDYSCGFRLYSVGALERGLARHGKLITENGFAGGVELLGKLRRDSVVAEVPLVLRYDCKRKASAMDVPKTVRGYFRAIASVRRAERREPHPVAGGTFGREPLA